MSSWRAEVSLTGPAGEPVDLWRTFISHGLTELPPMSLDEDARALELTLHVGTGRPRTIRIESDGGGRAVIRSPGLALPAGRERAIVAAARSVLRLDEDLSPFYALAADDPELAWVTDGAGRLARSPSVFEEVVKTICTTNCSWSATERMVGALVEHLGDPAAGAPPAGPGGRAFPSPLAMAEADESFYRDVARAGYRGSYLRALARAVAAGAVDLEELGRAPRDDLPDDEVERRLLELPGVGPYAAAHVMLLLGRYSRLVLDSWTRPKYARLTGRKQVSDRTIERRFRRYGPWAGLAFWLTVTRDWA